VRRGILELTLGMVARDSKGVATNGRSELDTALEAHGLNVEARRWTRREHGVPDSWVRGPEATATTNGTRGRSGTTHPPIEAGQRTADAEGRVKDESNPFFILNHADCILCGRCTVACQDVQHIGAIAMVGRATETHVGTDGDRPIVESICTSCGQCVSVCPTGAILPRDQVAGGQGQGIERVEQAGPRTPDAGLIPVQTVSSTCPYCGVGCGVGLNVDDQQIIRWVDDKPENRSSVGMLCVKGRFGTSFVHHGDRLTTPLIRRDGELVPCSWDEALEYTAERLVEHRGAFASLASAKGTNEDGYLQQKFVRLLMGTNNIDHCTRLCHSPSVEAMLQQLGSGATSNSYEDYEAAGCLMVIGCDPSSNHPVIASRIRRAIDEHGALLIVVNPRRIDLCNYTDLWLQPYPGTDVAVFNGLAKVILEEDLWDRDFVAERTEEFDTWLEKMERVDVAECARESGVPEDLLRRAARLYARPPVQARFAQPSATNTQHPYGGSCLIWGMGVTQHTNGTDNAHAILNLALLTGQLGTYGSGVSPLRGQNNVQGCGDAGCIPDSLPGYQGLGEDTRLKFAEVWGGPPPGEMGLRATDMIEQAVTGDIRAMYIVGENPLLSEPNVEHARDGVANLDFLVVQDIFLHGTAELAHVVLPAAAFAEKEGTFTNSERRVQRVRKAIDAPGLARPDWEIISDLAQRVAVRLDRDATAFQYPDAATVFAEMGRVWPSMAGLSHERLDHEGGIQWPCPTPDHPGTARLYTETFPRGLGKFMPVTQAARAAEMPDKRFPLILNTGRILYHWHGATITRRVRGLLARAPEVQVAVNPADATAAGFQNGDEVIVSSRRGEMSARVLVTEAVRQGEVFVPFARLAERAANWLTNNVYDETSRIPEYKVCAVRLDQPGQAREWRRGRRRLGATPIRAGEE
jgi:formate dehydrogenase alpha subunit